MRSVRAANSPRRAFVTRKKNALCDSEDATFFWSPFDPQNHPAPRSGTTTQWAEYNLCVSISQYNGYYNQSAPRSWSTVVETEYNLRVLIIVLEYKCVNNTFLDRNKGNKPKLRPSKKKLPPQEWPGQGDLGEGGVGTTVQNIHVRVCYNHTKHLIVTTKHPLDVSTSWRLRHCSLLIIIVNNKIERVFDENLQIYCVQTCLFLIF